MNQKFNISIETSALNGVEASTIKYMMESYMKSELISIYNIKVTETK